VSTPPTVILPYNTPPTVILEEPRKSSAFEGSGEKLGKEFDDASTEVDDKIKHLETYLNYKANQNKLSKKNGGRRSKKAQRKHRKKTSKRKSRK
jgi:hypothetical protein